MNETLNAIFARRSVRKYEAAPLTAEEMDLLLKAADAAPSAANRQSTRIIGTQDAGLIKNLTDQFGSLFTYGAPALIFLYSLPVGGRWASFNAALAAENICIAAESMGLNTVQLGCCYDMLNGAGKAEWNARLGLPEEASFELVVAIGHGAETPALRPRNPENIKLL